MGHIYGVTVGAVLGVLLDLHIGRVIRNKWNSTFGSGAISRGNKSECI